MHMKKPLIERLFHMYFAQTFKVRNTNDLERMVSPRIISMKRAFLLWQPRSVV